MNNNTPMRLNVEQIEERSCRFELSWGNGLRLVARVGYPTAAIASYQHWRKLYLDYYAHVDSPPPPTPTHREPMRGRTEAQGSGTTDRHRRLVEAEANLQLEFNRWLRDGELYESEPS